MRIVKHRNFPEADTIVSSFVERNDPEINKTLFELMPDYRIDAFLSRMSQYSEATAYSTGKIVRSVDPNTSKILANEVASFMPVRRQLACDAIRFTGMGRDFVDNLCKIAETDDETNVRIAALNALADVLVKEAIVTLQDAMQDKSFVIREAAAASAQKWMTRYREATTK